MALLTLLFVVLGTNDLEGQEQVGTIRGEVVDLATGRPLAGAAVRVLGGPGPTLSDASGRFVLTGVPLGTVSVRAELIGYRPRDVAEVRVSPGRAATVRIELETAALDVAGIEVRVSPLARRVDAPLSTVRLTAEEVRRTAGAQTDISRTLLSLPGVLGGVDNRNDLLVRGGGPGENTYWVDGIRVPRINHFETQGVGGGALGLLNVEFIEDADFLAGGFPARYGDALSSALVIRNRSGSPDRFRGDFTVGATEAGVTLDGPLPGGGTMLFSLRRSYLQLLFSLIDLPIRPAYWDTQLRAEWDLGERDRITLLGLGAIDELELVPPSDGDRAGDEILRRSLDNDQWGYTNGVVWQRLLDRGTMRVSASRSMDRFVFEGRSADDGEVFVSNDAWEAENRLRIDADLRVASAVLGVGAEVVREGIRSDFLDAGGVGRPVEGPLRFEDTVRWSKGAGWIQLSGPLLERRGPVERVSATAGVRLDGHGLLESGVAGSPRGGLTVELPAGWELSVAGGRFLQAPPALSLAVQVDGELVNEGLPWQEARHLVGGVAWAGSSGVRMSMEGFWKPYRSMPRSAADPRVVLQNEGGDFGFVGAEPLVSDARGRARGVELFARGSGRGPWYGLASYTLSWSEFEGADGVLRPSAWDARHAVDLTGGVRLGEGDRWEVGGRWRMVSGRPFTPFDPVLSPVAFERTGLGVPDRDRLNEGRGPAYHKLDLRVDRRVRWRRTSGRVYLDLQNVYNRTNVFGYLYTDDPTFPDGLRPREEIGFLPSVGLTVEW